MVLKQKHSMLFVDDEKSIIKALKRLFRKEGYNIITASNGREGLELLKQAESPVSLIISDQKMPQMTGAQFLEKAKEIFPDAIRFLLTGYSDMDAIVDAVNKGEIHRYLTKPWNNDDLLLQVQQALEHVELVLENRRLLELTNKQNRELTELNGNLEKKVKDRTRQIIDKNSELKDLNSKLEKSFLDTLRLLSSLIGTLNPILGRYMRQTADLAKKVAMAYGLKKEELDQIEIAGMIHDIGLLGLPEKFLLKNENDFNEQEFKLFAEHPIIGSICLESVDRLNEVSRIILCHHEHIDGSGFPKGLKGAEIPLGSRIIGAVSDYCRMVNTWPKDMKFINDIAQKYFGSAVREFIAKEPEKLIEEVAQKIIFIGVHHKYDIEVVTKLLQELGESGTINNTKNQRGKYTLLVDLDELKEGMALATDLRIQDGRLLLVKGTKLNKLSIESIQRLGKRQAIDKRIYIYS